MIDLTLNELRKIVAEADNFCHSSVACRHCPAYDVCRDDDGFPDLVISFVQQELDKKEKDNERTYTK